MKISELLLEEDKSKKKPASNLPTAASINDTPDDEDLDDVEDDVEDDESQDDLNDLKNKMGSMGNDLYTVSAYNYDDEFSSIGPNRVIMNILTKLDNNSAVAEYISQNNMDITDDKIISAVILNDRNGKLFAYYCGSGINRFSPGDVTKLVSDGIIDQDQAGKLNELKGYGADYRRIVSRIEWKAGYEARNSKVYDAMNMVISTLDLPPLPREVKISYHDLDRETPEEEEARRLRVLARIKEKEKSKPDRLKR